MGSSRRRKQWGLIAGFLAGVCLIATFGLTALGVTGLAQTWPLVAVCAIVLLGAFVFVFGQGTLPSPEEVAAVVEQVAAVRDRGVREGRESNKGRLRYYLPADWRASPVGREGWMIRPRGLGAPVWFSIWGFEADSAASGASVEALTPGARLLATRLGFGFVEGSVSPREVAGQPGISYGLLRGTESCAQGFFWRYEGGDYHFVVEASSREHLQLIRPASEEFLRGFFMW